MADAFTVQNMDLYYGDFHALKDINMNIPEKFDFIKEEDLPILIERALKEGNPLYPVPKIMDKKDCEAVIRSFMA